MVQHDFKVQTTWQGGRNEVGEVIGDVINEQISIPSSLDGTGMVPIVMHIRDCGSLLCYNVGN